MKAIRFLFFGVVLLGFRVSGQDYAIQLHRPLSVGQKYELSALGKTSEDSVTTTNGKVERTNRTDVTVELEATVTVLAVSDGRPIKQSLAVRRFKRTENGTLKILAGSGSIVIASAENGKRIFTL